jgi:hypothetical protein
MKKLTKEQRKKDEDHLRKNPINVFTCCGKSMEFKEFKEHLANEHKLTEAQFKGNKRMVAHIDGDYWFTYDYQWELETGLKFGQHVMMARAKDDIMRHG